VRRDGYIGFRRGTADVGQLRAWLSQRTELALGAGDGPQTAAATRGELTHYSDRGSQYTASAYQAVLAAHRIPLLDEPEGDCLDNTMAEASSPR
jgi:transposase InsO family protein